MRMRLPSCALPSRHAPLQCVALRGPTGYSMKLKTHPNLVVSLGGYGLVATQEAEHANRSCGVLAPRLFLAFSSRKYCSSVDNYEEASSQLNVGQTLAPLDNDKRRSLFWNTGTVNARPPSS